MHSIPGHYSDDLEVWVEESSGKVVPLVESQRALTELVTKTLVQQEQDDDLPPGRIVCELATKTDVRQESDDRSPSEFALELATKTSHNIEHDDQSRSII